VWWPLRGNFANLHPEYEVADWRGRHFFCDFAWLTPMTKLIIEIKGFGPHVRDMDRQKYCNELNRETFLTAMGFQVISFSYDDVADRPELCITLLRMVLSRYQQDGLPTDKIDPIDKEIIRLAYRLGAVVRPIDIQRHLKINPRSATRRLIILSQQSIFHPIKSQSQQRTTRYTLDKDAFRLL